MKTEIKERILLKLLTVFVLLCIVGLTALTVCVAETQEGTATIGESGDVLFYILVALLVVAVIAICIVFRRSKRFVVKERERAAELNKETPPSKEIRVYDEEYVNAKSAADKAKRHVEELAKEESAHAVAQGATPEPKD